MSSVTLFPVTPSARTRRLPDGERPPGSRQIRAGHRRGRRSDVDRIIATGLIGPTMQVGDEAGEVLGTVEDRRSRGLCERSRIRHRHPPLRPFGDSLTSPSGIATNPDRDRLLDRWRIGKHDRGPTIALGDLDTLPAPHGIEHVECVVETIVALVERHTECIELRCEVADPHAERESSARNRSRVAALFARTRVPVAEHRQVGEHRMSGSAATAAVNATNGSRLLCPPARASAAVAQDDR